MKLCGSVLCVLLLAVVRAVVGAPTDYASVRAEVVKAYAQQAEEMARALEVLQETSASTSAAAQQITECLHGLMAPNPCLSDCRPPLVRRRVPSTKAKKNRQGWRAGFEFLRLQPFLMLYVLRSQVSQG